ncbi:hypothetical protein BJ165DRAFT_1484529 [Panaeolus papilionaceus]|nr:hypothetical protein BJ165DRAFT_1484529 [Panaeolus papilionaceus]
MAPALASTYGLWLVSFFLEGVLYGCAMLQAWLYFHWYHNDHRFIRWMILLLVLLETLQMAFVFTGAYLCLITHFGDFEYLQKINWADAAQFPTYMSTFVVQIYFASCIYRLKKDAKFLPILIVILAVIEVGAGIVHNSRVFKLIGVSLAHAGNGDRLVSILKLSDTKPVFELMSASTLACDLLITASLVYRLNSSKLGMRATNSMLDRLVVYAINRGGLTAFAAAWNLIFFIALPNTFWFVLGMFIVSKLYMNSALASLNSRQHIRDTSASTIVMSPVDWHGMNTAGSNGSRRDPETTSRSRNGDANLPMIIEAPAEVHTERRINKRRSCFVDGMV